MRDEYIYIYGGVGGGGVVLYSHLHHDWLAFPPSPLFLTDAINCCHLCDVRCLFFGQLLWCCGKKQKQATNEVPVWFRVAIYEHLSKVASPL